MNDRRPNDRVAANLALGAATDDDAFATLLDATLAGDAQRCVAPAELAARVMHRLDYRPGGDAATGRGAARTVGGGPLARLRRLARSSAGRRIVRRAGHAGALVVVILAGFMINNALPSAVRSAPTTVPCAVERGLERQGARIDGLMRELHRAGPTFFVVPAGRAAPAHPSRTAPDDGRLEDDGDRARPGTSNGRATAPFRWVSGRGDEATIA